MPKQPYSTQFTARGVPRRYLLSGIPPMLWDRVRSQAKREGVSVRALILSLLSAWLRSAETRQGDVTHEHLH